jgi:hypothetical protein
MRRDSDQHAQDSDRCRVSLWQGYVTGQFYVRDPRDGTVVVSPAFKTWRPPWQPKRRPDDSPEAAAAFAALGQELTRLGWHPVSPTVAWKERVFVRNGSEPEPAAEAEPVDPTDIAEQSLLRALDELAGEKGATAAELGRALYGDAAASVTQLPQRLGSRLRRLQLQGKVARHQANGANQWLVVSRDGADNGARHRH